MFHHYTTLRIKLIDPTQYDFIFISHNIPDTDDYDECHEQRMEIEIGLQVLYIYHYTSHIKKSA